MQRIYGKNFKTNNENIINALETTYEEDCLCFGELEETLKGDKKKKNKVVEELRKLNTFEEIKKFSKKNVKDGGEIYTDLPRIENFEYIPKKNPLSNKPSIITGNFVYDDKGNSCKIEFNITSNLGNFYANHATYDCNMLMNIMNENGWDISKCGLKIGKEPINDLNELNKLEPIIFQRIAGGCKNIEEFKEKLTGRNIHGDVFRAGTIIQQQR